MPLRPIPALFRKYGLKYFSRGKILDWSTRRLSHREDDFVDTWRQAMHVFLGPGTSPGAGNPYACRFLSHNITFSYAYNSLLHRAYGRPIAYLAHQLRV